MTPSRNILPPRPPRTLTPEQITRDATVRAAWEGGASLKATARAAGVATTTARDILARMGLRPAARGKRNGIAGGKGRAETVAAGVLAPRLRLPLVPGHLVPTAGVKLDCERWTACLSAHVATYPTAEASCPPGPDGGPCRWLVPVGRLAGEYTYAAEGGAMARMTG